MAKAGAKKTELAEVKAEQTTAISPSLSEGAWGSEGVHGSDLLIPKILVMQGLSKLVSDGKATVGQVRESLNGDLLGGKEKPVELIAFSSFRTWVIFEKKDGKDEYVKTVPITSENEAWPINEVIGGVEVRRDKCLNFYVLRPEDIEAGVAFPYLLSLRRYGMQAGKKMSTFAAKLKAFKKPMAAKTIMLSVDKQENDKGTFFVFNATMGRDTTPAELTEAHTWYKTVQTAQVKHDDSDLKTEAAPAHAPDESQEY